MTTIASKSGLRAAGSARTRKAAQTTPLPPKREDVELAREAVAEATLQESQIKSAQARKSRKREAEEANEARGEFVAEHGTNGRIKGISTTGMVHWGWLEAKGTGEHGYRHVNQDCGVSAAHRASLGVPSAEAYDMIAVTCKRCVAKYGDGLEIDMAREESMAEAPKAKPAKKASGTIREPKPEPADLGDTKAHRNAAAFATAGWKVNVTEDGDYAELIAERGDESIHQAWVNGVYHNDSATYTIADRTVKTRNVAEAKKWAGRTPVQAQAELDKVGSNKAFVRRAPTQVARKALPFTLDAPERAIVDGLAGKNVYWLNRLSNTEEAATLSADPHRIQVREQLITGERIVLTCSAQSGFRAFYLSALLQVGGHRRSSAPAEKVAAARSDAHQVTVTVSVD